ncbi:hypothetical protein C8J57DRAFT_1675701 [Mycena rebaudengoi]|nr:hypothetical protein C8J57DRAFT_1675701 [Mycena rebaudengoi]
MAHPLVFPGKYFFYPIGNTSAVSLLRDIAPEQPANLLLLGCGDPRNVLYSIFCEAPGSERPLDFTCCDIDPAILGEHRADIEPPRNVLLLSLVADNQTETNLIWDIFFHFYLDKESLSVLTAQCTKLLAIGDSLEQWGTSAYAPFIRMCTLYTLTEIRRHWTLYVGMHNLPALRMGAIQDAFRKVANSVKGLGIGVGARSAGPIIGKALKVCPQQLLAYWQTGTTFSKAKQLSAATLLNPTFAYSLYGEGCNVHYGTDPVTPFHSAALFGNARGPVSVDALVNTARTEFSDWCSAFSTAVSLESSRTPLVRLFVGEATAVCQALKGFSTTGALNLGIPVAQWKTQLIQLSRLEYSGGKNAPAAFNVIDTSNLSDHVGLLNILTVAVPLLVPGDNVLYSETLLFHGTDATKEFANRLYADIHTIGILLGVSPLDYHSGFSSRSNTHELRMYDSEAVDAPNQFHQTTTWKAPTSGDPLVSLSGTQLPPVFDGRELGTLLYDMYHHLFEQEDSQHFWRINANNVAKAVAASNLVNYMRESFVLFLKVVREHLQIPDDRWLEVIERFIALKEADPSLPMDSVNYQDLCGHLHYHGMYTVPFLHITSKNGRLAAWDTVPPLVRIILVVPRDKFEVLYDLAEKIGTPVLQCDTRGKWTHNIFTAIHAAFGTVIPMGTKARPRVIFQEDPQGWNGSSPIIVSFTMSAGLLNIERAEDTRICFSVRSTPASVTPVHCIFSANLTDEYHVHVLPQDPLPPRLPSEPVPDTPVVFQIGKAEPVAMELDEECELISRLTATVAVEDKEAKKLFGAGAIPKISQVSPCAMELAIGGRAQTIIYPCPIMGSQNKLRLARKSSYIEVIVPVSGPFKQDGMKINPFPVVGSSAALYPWNIHRVNLDCLPILTIKTSSQKKGLNGHVSSMMSSRERALRKASESDALMHVKDTLHALFATSSGSQGGPVQRVFSLSEKESHNSDTVFFISDFRFDLSSHTILCDGYVLPLTKPLLARIETPFRKAVNGRTLASFAVSKVEIQAWKRLLPALVERCRSWKHTRSLTQEMERDPLCSCGRGKDVAGMTKVAEWSELAPFGASRGLLSPLFAVSYLERVGRDPAAGRCFVCRGKGKPTMMKCACGKVRYCSKECQKKDWKAHKPKCKLPVVPVNVA